MDDVNGGASAAVVLCSDVHKIYGEREVVKAFNLRIPRGSCFGLLGPNGAGKTTALRLIYGLTRPTRGSVRVFDLDVHREPRQVRQRIGVTLQENALVEELSPIENLRIFGRYHRLEPAEIERRVDELLVLLDLSDHAETPVKLLSGGYQRRVAIARSLINRPELLILDEPTTGLDPAVRAALWERVRGLREAGTTVLLTTHYMDEAERLCDELVVMSTGEVIAAGSPADLIERHLKREALELEVSTAAELGTGPWAELLDQTVHLRSGGRVMLYADDASELRTRLFSEGDFASAIERSWLRPTDLEDVFLAITGTTLREGA